MLTITLPDGQTQTHSGPVTALTVAQSIGPRLVKATIAAKVNGHLQDVATPIAADATVELITLQSEAGLEVLRHSTAHLMAQAVKRVFPRARMVIGPVIADGFYYDFAFERPFTEDDLQVIEQTMRAIVQEKLTVAREVYTRTEALALFQGLDEDYKVRLLEDLPDDETISCYRQGEFIDLCRGPHVPHTGLLKAFKLTKVSGAYWRGDANNETLQRIYGTAWPDRSALEAYLTRLAEAQKRDHRHLGKQMHWFHLQDIAPGMVFWHERGWTMYRLLEQYIRRRLQRGGYREIRTPQLVDRSLWEQSGHCDKFGDDMFFTETEHRTYAIKPMNCPCHVQVFNQGLVSYRDLPVRLAEFGSCHRREASGTLHGLMRVRQFVQDDAHIFCRETQLQAEVMAFMELLFSVYRDLGFTDISIKLSTRPARRVGDEASWDKAELALQQALAAQNLTWTVAPGEGAFYGPKLEFTLHDCLQRPWQCGTMQVDFSTPGRLGASYVAEDGSKQVPVMLHRAILGSFERFIGILIEHYAGLLPVWLAPLQAVVLNITDGQRDHARYVAATLQDLGFRVETDLRNEKIGFKIREHTLQRVPYHLVVGDREVAGDAVAVRTCEGQDLGCMTLGEFGEHLQAACQGLMLS